MTKLLFILIAAGTLGEVLSPKEPPLLIDAAPAASAATLDAAD